MATAWVHISVEMVVVVSGEQVHIFVELAAAASVEEAAVASDAAGLAPAFVVAEPGIVVVVVVPCCLVTERCS